MCQEAHKCMGSTGTDRGGSMKNLSMETKTLILLTEKGLDEKKLPPKDPKPKMSVRDFKKLADV